MNGAYYTLSFLCVATAIFVAALELRRNGKLTADPIGSFMVLLLLQCVIPGAMIFALLPSADRGGATTVPLFDKIYAATDGITASLVFALLFSFIVFTYLAAMTVKRGLVARFGSAQSAGFYEMRVSIPAVMAFLTLGLVVSLIAFMTMGDTFLERYVNTILLRSQSLGIERTALNSNALSLTQSWSWLSVIGLFAVAKSRNRKLLWLCCFSMLIVFSILNVSRRGFVLPVLFAYLIKVMNDDRWRVKTLAAVSVPALVFVAFGEELFGAMGYGGSIEQVEGTYTTIVSAALRTCSEIGITLTESLGTISMIDIPPRFGIDHLLSAAQRFPEGILGIPIDFPERMVRISTAAFSSPWGVDVPPGLMGQMWLDFRILGPFVWGIMLGGQVGILQYMFERTRRTLQSSAVYFVLVFVVALPINSGSFDFSFSVDILLLLVLIFFCIRMRRVVD